MAKIGARQGGDGAGGRDRMAHGGGPGGYHDVLVSRAPAEPGRS